MCTAVLHFSPYAARSSASTPQLLTSSIYSSTLKAGSSNWMTSAPRASSSRASLLSIFANCIALGFVEALALRQPRRPQLIGLREPRGLGEASGDCRLQQHFAH